jgi:hypothetical protein
LNVAVRDLLELPDGSNVLVDANIFINALNNTSQQCMWLSEWYEVVAQQRFCWRAQRGSVISRTKI